MAKNIPKEYNIIKKHRFRLPHLGLRIIKTGIAVFLCLLIYWLRGFDGLVLQSTVAAIICIQPYRSESVDTSINRIIGTLIGAAWAGLFLLMMLILSRYGIRPHILPIYILMGLGIMMTLYTTVVLKTPDAASLAAVVFICILGTYPDLDQPFLYMLDRIIDTVIGILVAGVVNSVTLPREKHNDYVFFVRLQDLVPDRYSHVDSNVLVILNRLYDDGAKVCLMSKWAPAFMLSQMGTMQINVPIIVMDGAALYDIPNRQYFSVTPLQYFDAAFLRNLLVEMGLAYGAYTVRDCSLLIYRGGQFNEAEKQEYELMKRSPYRNYVDGDFTMADKICFIRVIDRDDIIEELESRIHDLIDAHRFRIVRRPQHKMEGYSGLYFYHMDANVEMCKERLIDLLSEKEEHKLIPVNMMYNENYVSEIEAIDLLNRVRHIYEPIVNPLELIFRRNKDHS